MFVSIYEKNTAKIKHINVNNCVFSMSFDLHKKSYTNQEIISE